MIRHEPLSSVSPHSLHVSWNDFFFFYIETCITYTKLSYMWWHSNLLRKCLGRRGCTLWLSPSQWKITLGIEKLELQDIYMNKVVAELNKCLWESISLRFLLLLFFFMHILHAHYGNVNNASEVHNVQELYYTSTTLNWLRIIVVFSDQKTERKTTKVTLA